MAVLLFRGCFSGYARKIACDVKVPPVSLSMGDYGVGQGMIGTVLMLFFGLPAMTRSL